MWVGLWLRESHHHCAISQKWYTMSFSLRSELDVSVGGVDMG